MDILLLLVGLGLILGGANFLTDGSAAVAQRFRVPEFIIGLTIVAVGTSMPELVVSVLSAAAGNSDVAIGNVVGSNIFNVFVILGICALIRPLVLTKENIRRDIPFGMAASLVLLAVTSDRLVCAGATDRIGRPDGIVMLALYIGLMWYMIRTTKRQRGMPGAAGGTKTPASEAGAIVKNGVKQAEGTKKPMALWLAGVMIAGGLAGLIFGGEMFLKSATAIARTLGISESVIAITLVAGGTSLPELASSVVSLLKGKAEMALGNVIGSNIANILLILFFVVSILQRQVTGFAFNENRTDQFNLLFTLLSTIGLFAAFVLCNWSITTILEGKGRLREIWNYCAYALVPYILGTALVILMSNLLTTEEAAFVTMAQYVVYAWTGISLLMALKEVHMYTLGRTILTALLTLVGLVIILIVCALCYTILSQLVEFIGNVISELRMR